MAPSAQPPSGPSQAPASPAVAPAAAARSQTGRLFSPALYAGILGAGLIIGGRAACDYGITHSNPDDRDAVTMSRDVLHVRRTLNPKDTGDITDSKVNDKAEKATCMLQKFGFLPSDSPVDGVSAETWKSNNETRGKSIKTVFEDGKKKVTHTYTYRENLFGYYEDERRAREVNTLWQMARDPNWKDQLGWVMDSYLEKHPDMKGKKWEDMKDTWTTHAEEVFFGQRLECPKYVDGSCMKTWEGLTREEVLAMHAAMKKKDAEAVKTIRNKARDCLLLAPLARSVTVANRAMFEDGKGEIEPMTCYRNNLHQAILTVSIPGDGGCILRLKYKENVQNPGESNHGGANAMDVANRAQAEPYLSIAGGWQCDFVGKTLGRLGQLTGWGGGDDSDHCSIPEWGVSEISIAHKKRVEASVKAGPILDILKEGWKNRGAIKQ